jgi:hypothetical protein
MHPIIACAPYAYLPAEGSAYQRYSHYTVVSLKVIPLQEGASRSVRIYADGFFTHNVDQTLYRYHRDCSNWLFLERSVSVSNVS